MKYFISYRHTGAEGPRLDALQQTIKEALDARGDEFYSTYYHQEEFNDDNMTWSEILLKVLSIIDDADALFVLVDSKDISEGMLVEIGYSIGKRQKVIIAKNSEVRGLRFPDLADKTFEYDSLQVLRDKIIAL